MSVNSQSISPNFLPNLPGFRPKLPVGGGKKSYFKLVDKQVFLKDEYIPQFDDEGSIGSFGASTVSKARKQVADSSKNVILHFQGYFMETVEGSPEPQVRNVNVYFYVEDGSIKVVEKPQMNSGVTQGTIVKRAVIMKEGGNIPITEEDLRVGECITIYGRHVNLTSSDRATKEYLETNFGIYQQEPVETPVDPYTTYRKTMEAGPPDKWGKFHAKKNENKTFNEAVLGHSVDNSGRDGFIKFGSQTLKFRCVWDDTSNLYGDVIEFSLTYHLADDMLEILSIPSPLTKEQNRQKLLKKSKLPKNFHSTMTLGARGNREEFFHWSDFYIGMELEVYGRNLQLVDADRSTRDFYEQQDMPLGGPIVLPQPEVVVHEREIPPPTGFGSEEDSLRSITGSLMPGPPPMKKLGENKVLSFLASLASGGIDDVERRFVITYYVQDNTLKIMEPPMRNSGFNGGCFLSRRSVKHVVTGENINERDFFVGRIIKILKHEFLLLDTNDTTLRWMEDKGFSQSNFYGIVDQVRPILRPPAMNGTLTQLFKQLETPEAGAGFATKETLFKVFDKFGLMGELLSDHELRTILRANGNKNPTFNYAKLIEQIIRPTDEFK